MIHRSSLWPTQVAYVAVMEADEALMFKLRRDGIYSDVVPPNTPTPYLTLGEPSEARFGTFGRAGSRLTDTFHIWSTGGRREVLAIYEDLVRLLDGQVLPLNGHLMLTGRVELATVFLDPDNETMHGVVRYEAITQNAVA